MNDLITKSEACKLLGVQKRTLYKYLNRGYIKKVNHQNRIYLDKKDILKFRGALENPLPKTDAITVAKMNAQMREQEEDIKLIKRVLDLYNEPLELPDFSIHALYTAVCGLELDTWDEGWEKEWAELLIRFREEDFFQLEKITGDEHPWKPFYKFILVVQELIRKREDRELTELYNAAREHFRKLILIWLEIKQSPKELDTLPKSEFGRWVMARMREKYNKTEKRA